MSRVKKKSFLQYFAREMSYFMYKRSSLFDESVKGEEKKFSTIYLLEKWAILCTNALVYLIKVWRVKKKSFITPPAGRQRPAKAAGKFRFWGKKKFCFRNKKTPKTIIGNGTARFFAFSLIIEGTTEKALQFTMPVKSINSKNLCFGEQKMYF